MRFIVFALIVCVSPFVRAVGLSDYAGTWTLDRSASKDLPGFYDQVARHLLTVARQGDELRVTVAIDSTAGERQQQALTYRMDGEKTQAQAAMRTPDGTKTATVTSTARVNADGSLSIDSERVVPGAAAPMRDSEHWVLAGDDTLRVERSFSAGGPKPFVMTFRRDARS